MFKIQYFYFLLIFISCKNNNNKNETKIPFDQKQEIPNFKILIEKKTELKILDFNSILSSKVIVNDDYIMLESIPESLIGAIDKIVFTKEKIYILDKTLSNNIFIFNMDGKFLKKIEQIGEGPNEIFRPYDFDVSEKGEVLVYDGVLGKMVYYNQSLIPIKQKKIFSRFINFKIVNNNNFLVAVGGIENQQFPVILNYDLLLLDSTFNIIKKGFKLEENKKKNDLMLRENLHHLNNEEAIFSPKFLNKIFKLNKNTDLENTFYLNFSQKEINIDTYSKSMDAIYKETLNKNNYFFGGDYIETDSIVYFKLNCKLLKNEIIGFYEKKNKIFNYGKLKMDNLSLPAFAFPIANYKNKFISYLEPDLVSNIKNYKSQNLKISPKLLKISNLIKEGDNPVIFSYNILLKK